MNGIDRAFYLPSPTASPEVASPISSVCRVTLTSPKGQTSAWWCCRVTAQEFTKRRRVISATSLIGAKIAIDNPDVFIRVHQANTQCHDFSNDTHQWRLDVNISTGCFVFSCNIHPVFATQIYAWSTFIMYISLRLNEAQYTILFLTWAQHDSLYRLYTSSLRC